MTDKTDKEESKEELELEKELYEINFKNINQENYSVKKHQKKKKKGKRGFSPWWFLQNRVMNRYYNKDMNNDFTLKDRYYFKPQVKKKDMLD